MKISRIALRNFRRLQDVEFTLEPDSTIFVGPNNSGKTSATAAFRLFFKRSEFTISDFNVACIRELDDFGKDLTIPAEQAPNIQLDLWLDIDPNQIEFGRAFALIPNVGIEHNTVGMRLSFEAVEADDMRSAFKKTFPNEPDKSLSDFLSLAKNLSRHYTIQYYALHQEGEYEKRKIEASLIEPEEGRRVLNSLIRLDFIDAQRNIHDEDSGRHNRLSSAFAAFYKQNLQKPAENKEAMRVIDENNAKLTKHYDEHFEGLLKNVAKLGVPSAHDRTLRLVSSLSPHEALRGSTELYYEDATLKHRLPEAYNGLGFKNLIYMAIQVSHFYAQWMATEINRPLCQLIFIEEPEVHLHAQVQQVFISNIYKIIEETTIEIGEDYVPPQLVISTHSSHVVDTVDFEKVRYFRRCPLKLEENDPSSPLVASKVSNLQDFKAESDPDLSAEEESEFEEEVVKRALLKEKLEASRQANLDFLKKYMRLTHSDLFFADAAILVEGTVEKLLMTQMINKAAPDLENCYITVLEVGGAFAHKFVSLIKFLGIPYVVITDIDTVLPSTTRSACPARTQGCNTSNATLKYFFKTKKRDSLLELNRNDQVVKDGQCFVAFQRPVTIKLADTDEEFHGRTFEEAFVYENLHLFRSKKVISGYDALAHGENAAEIAKNTYDTIRSNTFKKTEFALSVAVGPDWTTPQYIIDGLSWLVEKLRPPTVKINNPNVEILE